MNQETAAIIERARNGELTKDDRITLLRAVCNLLIAELESGSPDIGKLELAALILRIEGSPESSGGRRRGAGESAAEDVRAPGNGESSQ